MKFFVVPIPIVFGMVENRLTVNDPAGIVKAAEVGTAS
jgi:uncharacterized membrane protein